MILKVVKTSKKKLLKPNTKVNGKYLFNILYKNAISEMNKVTKHNKHLFMEGRPRAHTAKLTLEILKYKKQL